MEIGIERARICLKKHKLKSNFRYTFPLFCNPKSLKAVQKKLLKKPDPPLDFESISAQKSSVKRRRKGQIIQSKTSQK